MSQDGKPVRILQLTDFHLLANPQQTMMGINTEQSFLALLDMAARHIDGFDLVLMTGDLAQDPVNGTYLRLRNHLGLLPLPCYCLPGNHDKPSLIRQVLANGNVFCQTQILLDNWQIVCLDSTIPDSPCGYLAQGQLDLLESLLADEPDRHAMVCFHHSPLPTGTVWLDTMKLANSDKLFLLLERFPQTKAIVCGHIHQELEASVGHVRVLGCPSSCFQFKQGSVDFALDFLPPGYRWIELYPDGSIATQVVRMDKVPSGLNMAANGY